MPHRHYAASQIPNLKNKKKILVYLFGSLGDSIVAIPALRAVRRHFQEAEIVLLQNFQTGNIVKASQVIPDELVDRYLSYNSHLGKIAKLSNFYRLWHMLRGEQFDAAVYLVISERTKKAVRRDRLFFRSCGIQQLYGFHAFSIEELYPVDADRHPAVTEQEAVRKLRRIAIDGVEFQPNRDLQLPLIKFSPPELGKIDEWLEPRRKRPFCPLIAIAPGTKGKANAWPLENFIRLGSLLMVEGNYEIIVVGGNAEREMGEQLTSAWNGGINSAGAFSIRESGALISKCHVHIGLDTGTTHLAAAAGTRCFVIFGERANPGHWYPLGNGHAVVYHPVECAGCRLQECPIPDHPCMTGISLESVWRNLRTFLNNSDSDSPVNIISV